MSPIAVAIAGALGRLDEENIKQLYTALKKDIESRYDANLAQALANLEQNPNSEPSLEELEDELIVSGARKDKALRTLARTLGPN